MCRARLVCEVKHTLHSYGDDESREKEVEEEQGAETKGETARVSRRGKTEAKDTVVGDAELSKYR